MPAVNALSIILRDSGLTYTAQGGRIRVVPATTLVRAAQREEQSESSESPTAKSSSDIKATPPSESATDETSAGYNPLETSRTTLDTVVVTAQKREERLIDVPISIVAVNANQLEARNITSINDLTGAVPGLAIQSSGSYQRRIFLRGVSNTFGNSSLIGLYLDEAAITSNPSYQLDVRTYDLERVEVLRGPQGTLYGEGSVGGTIRFITKDPVLDRFGMNIDSAALFTPDGASGQRIVSALNVPLIENQLGLRIAGDFEHEGGWIDQPAADQKNFNDENLVDVRIKGLWEPAPQFRVSAMALIHRDKAPPDTGENPTGTFTQEFNLTTTPSGEDDYNIYNLTLSYDFNAVRLLSTTSYITQDKELKDHGGFLQLTPPGTPQYDYYSPYISTRTKNVNQELRLTSTGSGAWEWTVGGFYRHFWEDDNGPLYFGVAGPPGTPLPPLTSPAGGNNASKSLAVFGDTSYKVTDRFTLGTGVRYFKDDEQLTSEIITRGPVQTGTFHSVDPRAYMQYTLTDQVHMYASAAKGFRSGGFNSENQPNYGPESVWTYEVGTKMSLLENRLSVESALFYSDYSNYVIVGFTGSPPTNIYSNAGSATIKGSELGLTVVPVIGWSVSLNGDYTDSYFTKLNVTNSSYDVGDPLDLTPKYNFDVSLQRDFSVNSKRTFIRLDYSQMGRETYRNRYVNGPAAPPSPWYFGESDVIHMLNLNTSLYWSDNLRLGVFVQNLLNDRGYTDPFRIEGIAARAHPLTLGIEADVTLK